MDDMDDSVEFIEGTPSPVFSRLPLRKRIAKASTICLSSSDDEYVESWDTKNQLKSQGDNSSSKQLESKSADVGNKLSLPGQSGFAAERAEAIRRKKMKDSLSKTNGMSKLKRGPSDEMSDLTTNMRSVNSRCPDFVKSSDLLRGLSDDKAKNDGNSSVPPKKRKLNPAEKYKPYGKKREQNMLRWPSSSDTSSDDEDEGSGRSGNGKFSLNRRSVSAETFTTGIAGEISGFKKGIGCGNSVASSVQKNMNARHTGADASPSSMPDTCNTCTTGSKCMKRKPYCSCTVVNTTAKCSNLTRKDTCTSAYSNKGCFGCHSARDSLEVPHKKYKVSPTGSTAASSKLYSTSPAFTSSFKDKATAKSFTKSSSSVNMLSSGIPTQRVLPTTSKVSAATKTAPGVSANARNSTSNSPLLSRKSYTQQSRNSFVHSPSARNTSPNFLLNRSSLSPDTNASPSTSSSMWLSKNSASKRSLFGRRSPPTRLPNSTGASSSTHSGQQGPSTSGAAAAAGHPSVMDNTCRVSPLTPATKQALDRVQQLEKDEDVARKLQEELDREFAMSLQSSVEHQPPFLGAGVSAGADERSGPSVSSFQSRTPPGSRRRRPATRRMAQAADDDDQENDESAEAMREELLSLLQDAYHSMHSALGSPVDNEYLVSPRRRRGGQRGGRRGRRNGMAGFMFNASGLENDYDHLLNLAEALGDVKEKGLSELEISRLPTVTYQPAENAEAQECNICMTEYEKGDSQKILPCFHSYHATCIDKWIQKNATCPVCRVEVKL